MGKRKIKTVGGVTYIGAKADQKHAPDKCIRDGKVCAFRTKVSGMKNQPVLYACGYCYYTGKTRGEVVERSGEETHIEYEEECSKWAEELPETVLVMNVEEEDRDYECET